MFCPGKFEKYLIAVDADYVSVRCNSLSNSRCNRARSAADIKHVESWMKKIGEATVIPIEGSSLEYARIGPV